MAMRARFGVCLTLALAALLAAGASAAAARNVPRSFYGMVYDGAVRQAPLDVQRFQFAAMRRAGVESVRAVFSWAAAQPQRGGPFDFGATDELVTLASEQRISLLPVIIETPQWARLRPSRDASPPAHPADYARYVRALVARYGHGGSFWAQHPELQYQPLSYWQIWNEPHLRLYWDAARWQRGYGALLRAAHRAALAVDRRARIVLAGMTGASWDALASLYRQGRVRGAFDVAALQTYTGTALHLLHAVHLFRGVLVQHHASRLPLWITEMGWPAAQGRISVPSYQRTIATTDRGMAARLKAGYALITSERRRANALVSRVYWYTWASPYSPSRDPGTGIFRYAGLFRYDGSNFISTPSFRAYARSARQHER
ncbi:MAG TPA: beta-galactosidase [Thermoleophilaceae bacterium]|nr:beta-galactosidase [Thermoleophilaceae bacterium]